MKYQVGDEIVVLHTNEEGKVVEIINNKMVMIEVRGVKFPSYIDQIDFPYFKRFTEKKPVFQQKKEKKFVENIPKEKSKPTEVRATTGVWLSLTPKFTIDEFGDEVPELFKIHLVNRTETGYRFEYMQQFLGKADFELSNEIIAFHDFYLHDISFADFNDNPSFIFDLSLITPDKKKANHYEASVKIKAKQLFQRLEEMKQKNEPTIVFRLFDKYPEKQVEEKIKATCPEVKWLSSYAVFGPYDYVDIFEAPSLESALKVSTIVRSFGRASTEVWPSFKWNEFKNIISDVPEV